MIAPATFHPVCGSTGAGKTTYTLQLVEEQGALRFTIDDWMVRLFGTDRPTGRQGPTGHGSPSDSLDARA